MLNVECAFPIRNFIFHIIILKTLSNLLCSIPIHILRSYSYCKNAGSRWNYIATKKQHTGTLKISLWYSCRYLQLVSASQKSWFWYFVNPYNGVVVELKIEIKIKKIKNKKIIKILFKKHGTLFVFKRDIQWWNEWRFKIYIWNLGGNMFLKLITP